MDKGKMLTLAFIPKAMIKNWPWQVFWLTSLSDAFPSGKNPGSGRGFRKITEVYSCGYSSGFAPDSLFIRLVRTQALEPNPRQM